MKIRGNEFAAKGRGAAADCRIFFFCGQDEAGERVELSGADLRGDPARLGDEARSTSLFGDKRHIWVRATGDDAHDALKTLIDTGEAGAGEACPVIVVATSATDKSRTAKLLEKRKDALVALFYPPDLRSVVPAVRAMADAAGLRLGGDLAERIARASSLDVRLAQSEIDKLALYLDSSPQSPKQADQAAFDAICAVTEEDGIMPLVNAALSGEARKLPAEIRRLRESSINPVGVALALERRAAQLAALSAKMRPGEDIGRFLESERVFFRDRRDIDQQLRQWSGGKLERLVPRLTNLHRALLGNSAMAELLLAQELAQIARYAGARR